MTTLQIPTFLAPPAPGPKSAALHPRLVAAVRWDYEYGLLSVAQLVGKYKMVLSANAVREIAHGRLHPEIKAGRCALAWCKRTWRK